MKTISLRYSPFGKALRTSAFMTALAVVGTDHASAFLVTTLAGDFSFGPDAANYSESASLSSFAEFGTLVEVKIQLSGSAAITMFASVAPGGSGTVNFMSEDAAFSITGLPFASLSTSIPTYTVGPVDVPPDVSFNDTISAPTVSVTLTAPGDLAAYDFSMGAPALLPFMFSATETFSSEKTGSGISTGSDVEASASVMVWYTYDNGLPPPPVPEVSTAVSAAGFALVLGLFLFRSRNKASAMAD